MTSHVPRQSVYFSANASQNQLNSIHASLQRTQLARETLAETNAQLAHYTGDFDRIHTVLSNKRHFHLVSERSLRHDREQTVAEVLPMLRELLSRAEAVQEKDRKRAVALRKQAAEALAELDRTQTQASQEPPKTGSPSVAALVSHAELEEHKRQLQSLRVERERLEDRVNTLETRAKRSTQA